MYNTCQFTIDLTGVSDFREMYRRIYAGIEGPDDYGANPNALLDILTEPFGEPAHIILCGFNQMTGTARKMAEDALWAFEKTAELVKDFSYEIK